MPEAPVSAETMRPSSMAMPADLPRLAFDATPDALLALDADGVVVVLNRRAEAMLGFSSSEVIGRSAEDLLSAATPGLPSPVRQLLTGRSINGVRALVRRRTGPRFVGCVSGNAIATPDGAYFVVSLREGAEASEALAGRLGHLGQFAGGIAHDFNNLLAVVVNYAAFVAEELDATVGQADEEQWAVARLDIGHVRRAGEAAVRLTEQLLWLSRRDVLGCRPLDLSSLVATIETLLRRAAGADVELVLQCDPGLPVVRADEDQLALLLIAAACEARCALPAGGTFVVATSVKLVDDVFADTHPGLEPGRHVQLAVNVRGPGLDANRVRDAFEPFLLLRDTSYTAHDPCRTYRGIGGTAAYVEVCTPAGHGTTLRALIPT